MKIQLLHSCRGNKWLVYVSVARPKIKVHTFMSFSFFLIFFFRKSLLCKFQKRKNFEDDPYVNSPLLSHSLPTSRWFLWSGTRHKHQKSRRNFGFPIDCFFSKEMMIKFYIYSFCQLNLCISGSICTKFWFDYNWIRTQVCLCKNGRSCPIGFLNSMW